MARDRYIDLPGRMGAPPTALQQPNPRFEFDLSTAGDYSAALQLKGSVGCSEDDLWHEAPKVGRTLLLGDGGSGKTSILGRLWIRAREVDGFACWIDLRRWDGMLAKEWEEIAEDSWSAELLLTRLGEPRVSEQEIELAPPGIPILLLIDGINEVSNKLAERMIQAADYLARRHPHIGVVVTDRLVRRESVTSRWKLVRLVAARHGDRRKETILQNAFFLNLELERELEARTAGNAFHEYLERHAGLTHSQLADAAQAAAYAYKEATARAFDLTQFADRAGVDVVAKLKQAGQLVCKPPIAYFAHQLIHDTLAGDWLAADRDRWNAEWFDALTFKASSFDVIALALERLNGPGSVDAFLRRVYDWNYYGAAFALARAQEFGDVNISPTMRVALLAMLAERQWDPMVATADRVQDALRLIGGKTAERLLEADGFDEVRSFVDEQPQLDDEFAEWRSLFLRRPSDPTDRHLVEALRDQDSLIGWTAANVMRRSAPTEDALKEVIGLALGGGDDVVRWRAVHVLGAWPNPESAGAVQRCLLGDEDRLVRYGATRSLIDLAARSESLRDELLPWLTDHVADLPQPADELVTEIERALVRRPMPVGWNESVSDLVSELFSCSRDDRERDRWRYLAGRLREAADRDETATVEAS